ncbi:hypothetical protein NBRC116592_17080 [Colwellia sp. KU-HH00111]|uniref:hypothetical protein n=1 Tax=Colwellia sp. KU-HH00111 TaxID=3127652 RepID=UPI00310229CF
MNTIKNLLIILVLTLLVFNDVLANQIINKKNKLVPMNIVGLPDDLKGINDISIFNKGEDSQRLLKAFVAEQYNKRVPKAPFIEVDTSGRDSVHRPGFINGVEEYDLIAKGYSNNSRFKQKKAIKAGNELLKSYSNDITWLKGKRYLVKVDAQGYYPFNFEQMSMGVIFGHPLDCFNEPKLLIKNHLGFSSYNAPLIAGISKDKNIHLQKIEKNNRGKCRVDFAFDDEVKAEQFDDAMANYPVQLYAVIEMTKNKLDHAHIATIKDVFVTRINKDETEQFLARKFSDVNKDSFIVTKEHALKLSTDSYNDDLAKQIATLANIDLHKELAKISHSVFAIDREQNMFFRYQPSQKKLHFIERYQGKDGKQTQSMAEYSLSKMGNTWVAKHEKSTAGASNFHSLLYAKAEYKGEITFVSPVCSDLKQETTASTYSCEYEITIKEAFNAEPWNQWVSNAVSNEL